MLLRRSAYSLHTNTQLIQIDPNAVYVCLFHHTLGFSLPTSFVNAVFVISLILVSTVPFQHIEYIASRIEATYWSQWFSTNETTSLKYIWVFQLKCISPFTLWLMNDHRLIGQFHSLFEHRYYLLCFFFHNRKFPLLSTCSYAAMSFLHVMGV